MTDVFVLVLMSVWPCSSVLAGANTVYVTVFGNRGHKTVDVTTEVDKFTFYAALHSDY